MGLYEIFIEGEVITDTCFNPGWTAYEHRLLYKKFDVTTLFKAGENELRVYMGAGWYKGDLGYQISRNHYGDKMAFAAEIHIIYEDGEQEVVKTDTSFEYSNCEVLYSELYHGEIYDANNEPTNWKQVEIYQLTPSGRLAAPTQTAHILSLMFDLTPNKFVKRTIQGLVELIEDNGGHLVTGFLGTPYFCHALSQNGMLNEAYKLLEREAYPSWLFQVKQDATTIWEHLDGIKEDGSMWSPDMNSFNHYAYGAVGDWLYQVVAGIKPIEAGYKKIEITPQPGGSLKFAKGTLETPYGMVSSHWEMTKKEKEDEFKLTVEIPVNTTAIVTLPDGATHNVGSGKYDFTAKIKE